MLLLRVVQLWGCPVEGLPSTFSLTLRLGMGTMASFSWNGTSTPGASAQWGRGWVVACPLSLPFTAWKHHLRWGKDPQGPSLANMLSPSPEWGLGRKELQPLTCDCLGLSLINQQLQAGWESLKSCNSWKKAFLHGAGKGGWGGVGKCLESGGERVGGVLIQIPQTFLLKLRFTFRTQSKIHLS